MPLYNIVEHSADYSETTESLWFYSKDEAIDFNVNIDNDNNFKSFMYKAKLLGNTIAQAAPNAANGILKDATTAVPLEYLRSFKMPSINCKVELKLTWRKYCVLSAASADKTNVNPDNIMFNIKDTELCVHIVTLSARDNQKLSKLLSKGFDRSVCCNEYETKSENKDKANEYRYFLVILLASIDYLF